jgi:hypothetical protein
VINITLIIGMSFLGGAYFPARNLPAFFHENVSGHLPIYWFIETVRGIQFEYNLDWRLPLVKLVALGGVLTIAAAVMLRRQLLAGGRA